MNLSDILAWLQGKKTYITAILALIFNLGVQMAWWTPDNAWVNFINAIFGVFGFAFLRAGIAKAAKK